VMIERMREIAAAENIAIDDDALAAIAYRADGGLRDALTMLEQAAAFAEGASVTAQTLDVAFGATGRNYANGLIDAVLARDASAMLRTIEEASDAGSDMMVLIRSLIANFRNLLVARVDPELLSRDLAPEDAKAATARAEGVGQPTIVRALRVLSDAASLARSGGNPRLELETALLRFVLEDDVTLSSAAVSSQAKSVSSGAEPVSSRAESRKAPQKGSPTPVEKAPPAPKPEPKPVPTPPKAEEPSVTPSSAPLSSRAESREAPPKVEPKPKADGPVTVQKLRAAWMNIRGKVEATRPPLRTQLGGAMVEEIDGNAAVIKLRNKLDVDILKEHVKLLEDAINDILGASLKVRLEAGTASPPQNDEPKIAQPESADELFGYANERIK